MIINKFPPPPHHPTHTATSKSEDLRLPASIYASEPHPTTKKRLEFIDLAKGICIILVVCLHCKCEFIDGSKWLLLLRMPLYFILSGMFFKDYGGYLVSIEKKVNKLLVPFLAFYFAAYALNFGFGAYKLGLLSVKLTDVPFIGLSNVMNMNPPIWFLFALFDLYVIFLVVFRTFCNLLARIVTLVILSLCGVALSIMRIELPLYLSQSLFALPFFCYGYFLRKGDILVNSKLCRIPWWSWCLLLLAVAVLCENVPFNVIFMEYMFDGNWFLINVFALCIVVCVLFLCKRIGHLPIVSYIGRYSIVVLGTHMVMITVCLSAWSDIMEEVEMPRWLLSLCTLSLSSILVYPCVRYLPYFVAQKDLTQLLRKWGRRFKRKIPRRVMDL